MKTIIVGGNFGLKSKESGLINKLTNIIKADKVVNGGSIERLKIIANSLRGYELVLWMPNINNEAAKLYPKKDKGSVMIVSKVLRENRTIVDAVSRIFTMRGNAVIAINSNTKPFNFNLVDALGNSWSNSSSLKDLHRGIIKIYNWTKGSKRIGTSEVDNIDKFIGLNKIVADKFELIKERYFGNISTRCMQMFPSARYTNSHTLVSKRNSSKERLTRDDMVLSKFNDLKDNVIYSGSNKPSVDTPIQLSLFDKYPNINYIIHGHSYIEDAIMTDSYYPCGDMREYNELTRYISKDSMSGKINLRNHGFLIYGNKIEDIEQLVTNLIFKERDIGTEKVL